GYRRFHYDQRTAWRPVQLTKGSPASKRGAEKSIFAFDPGNALGLARQENCGLGAHLQAKHRRYTLLRRDRTCGRSAARGSAGDRVRPERDGEDTGSGRDSESETRRIRPRDGGRRRSTDHRHGMGGVRKRRSRDRKTNDEHDEYFRWAQLVRSRDNGKGW